jgi:hypothetical protein
MDRERAIEEQGRISSMHGKPWHQVPPGATFPVYTGLTAHSTVALSIARQRLQSVSRGSGRSGRSGSGWSGWRVRASHHLALRRSAMARWRGRAANNCTTF